MDKIICVGKNYLEHAKELGDKVPEKPVLFLKPPSVMVQAKHEGDTLNVKLPKGRGSVHHECEIVVRLDTNQQIDAVTLGLDMTLRDVQAELKKNGHPWEIAKVFAGSAILAPWIPIDQLPDYLDAEFALTIDGSLKQKAKGSQMRISPQECIAYVAEYFPLQKGDVIFTGTPAGVGPVRAGQTAELQWQGRVLAMVRWTD